MMAALCFAGSIGACSRYTIDHFVKRFVDRFALGTLLINLAGSFVLGLLAAHSGGHDVNVIAGTGFCGAFTTFSTFAFDTVRLLEERRWCAAGCNIIGNIGG